MSIVKRLKRQADTCAQLAAATYDEESRERYLRLEQLYRHMLEGDSETPVEAFPSEGFAEQPPRLLS